MRRKIPKYAITAAVCSLAVCQVANAALTIVSSSVGGAPNIAGVNKLNFDDLSLGSGGGLAQTPNGSATVITMTDGAVVMGTTSQYAAPWLSGGNGAGFADLGGNQPNGQDTTKYLTSGAQIGSHPNAAVTLQFSSLQKYFGLLWGSVDLYNTLSFYDGTTFRGSVTGGMVNPTATGNQGLNGTFYVNINSTLGFDKVVATSSQYAFEFDNVAYSTTPVPEPTTMIAGALLLLPFGISTIRRFRKN
jgi:hypothetical protein